MIASNPTDLDKYINHFLDFGKKVHSKRENIDYLEFISNELTINNIQDKEWNFKQIKKEYEDCNSRFKDQLQLVVDKLKEDESTRQALLMNWRESDLVKPATCPCIISLQFFIRNDKLICVSYLRSSNYATKFRSDISYIRSIIMKVAKLVKLTVCTLIIFQGSFHTPMENK